jgi:hypothetical protein
VVVAAAGRGAMLHADVAGWQSHRHSTHDRLMENTSMGQYATEREALRASRNAALHMSRSHDAAALGTRAHDPADGAQMGRAFPPVTHSVGSTRAVGPPEVQYGYGAPSPLAAAYAGYDAAFAGADGTRNDPRFVDARNRPSDAEVAYLRRELADEQRRLLALEEQLGQHKAREGRVARTVDVRLTASVRIASSASVSDISLAVRSPRWPAVTVCLAPRRKDLHRHLAEATSWRASTAPCERSSGRSKHWRESACGFSSQCILVNQVAVRTLSSQLLIAAVPRCRGLMHMRRMPQAQLAQMQTPISGPALGSAGPSHHHLPLQRNHVVELFCSCLLHDVSPDFD